MLIYCSVVSWSWRRKGRLVCACRKPCLCFLKPKPKTLCLPQMLGLGGEGGALQLLQVLKFSGPLPLSVDVVLLALPRLGGAY